MTEPEGFTISIAPNMKPGDVARLEAAVEAKRAAEQRAGMLLARIESLGFLKAMLSGQRFDPEERRDLLQEFYGDTESDDYAGCAEADGFTIPQLVKEIADQNEEMLLALGGHPPKK